MSDLIDRQAAIRAVNTALFPKINTAKDAEKALRDLPSAQPEHKRGRWMLADMYESTHKAMLCNKCNAAYDMTIAGGMFNYCPHCGADMRGAT